MNDAWLEELSYTDCLALLRSEGVGRVSVVVNECPIVLPVSYRLVETSAITWIAIRTRPGNVIEHAGTFAAFEIDAIDPAHRQGWSVLVRGTMHHVDPDAADFRERFDPDPWLLAERDAWLAIEPFAITGRRLHPATTEWGFHIRGYV
jgi:nitroimidazol reductase NimA-like FMN-containing flavoprotein (pyridoxamine 5'-phosphate oxidase superfamily)